jgi:hypothetical protein
MYECTSKCLYCKKFNEPHIKRFFNKVIKESECWNWTGYIASNGYGKFGYLNKAQYAHRFSFSICNKLFEGMVIDHLCRNRKCVNPKHLEQVTIKTNLMRSPIAPASINAHKTHCILGHKLKKDRKCHVDICRLNQLERYKNYNKTRKIK